MLLKSLVIQFNNYPDMQPEQEEDQHANALRLVRIQYDDALAIARTDPRALRGNKMRLLAEQLASANAVNTFAVHMNLIAQEESARVIKEFFDAHPDLVELLNDRGIGEHYGQTPTES